ncbi:MAG: hypothetical protein ACOCXH_14610 [Cyclobacteriaceae bacterium]
MNDTGNSFTNDENQVSLSFSKDEAKIIFDALSAHRFKISQKKTNLSQQNSKSELEAFLSQRLDAIDSEIAKADIIFDKLGNIFKEKE